MKYKMKLLRSLSSMVQSTVDMHNNKIAFAKALFCMPTTMRAEAMVKFMMFNLTFKIKGSYRDAIAITKGLTNEGQARPALNSNIIGIILNFAGLSPLEEDLSAIILPEKHKNSKEVANETLKLTAMIPPNRGNLPRSCSLPSQSSVRHG